MARRYTFDEKGNAERLWHGKKIEDFTEEDKLQFLIEDTAIAFL